jgi:hypothetical protein
MVGGVLVAQAFACFILLYPMLVVKKSVSDDQSSRMLVRNVRTSITIEIIMGLCWVLVGVLNDNSDETKNDDTDLKTTFGLLSIGFCLLILSCISLMLSFWPVVTVSGDSQADSRVVQPNAVSAAGDGSIDDLVEPLLASTSSDGSNHDQIRSDEELQRQLDENNSNRESGSDGNHQADPESEFSANEPTSRIRGTRRLLALAAPQVVYLYIGCITLLIRLPFSLSIPHFVSTTLGSLSRREYDRARQEVIWLFILGTVDAW